MADEESQVEEETSWWAFDAFADAELPSISIDEPLVWPDSLQWEEFSADAAPAEPPYSAPPPPNDLIFPADAGSGEPADRAPAPPQDPDLQWQPDGYDFDATMAATPLAGLGGGAPSRVPAGDGDAVQPLPETIWSFDGVDDRDDQVAGLATLAAPLVYADTDGRSRGKWPRRLDVRRGNVAVVALISAVSLVLLGMFLSVRSRNDLPTDATASPPRTDQIATAGTRNSVPTTTAVVTTTVPAPAINIADLLPPAEQTGAGGATGTAGGTPVATTAPARSTAAPAGGGSTTGTTQPAAQSTATTAAPEPPPADTTPAPTLPPPADQSTNTTNRPRTSTSVPLPSIPDFSIPSTGSTLPGGGFNFPGFNNIPRNDS